MPRQNPNSGRNVARYYHQHCGWTKKDARKEDEQFEQKYEAMRKA